MSYVQMSLAIKGEHIEPVDRPHPDDDHFGRIVNVRIGPLSLMCGGDTEVETEAELSRLLAAVTTLHDASLARLEAVKPAEYIAGLMAGGPA